jgi:hypothetical protein
MVALVEGAGFNIFQKSNSELWGAICMDFEALNAAIVAATGELIDARFR